MILKRSVGRVLAVLIALTFIAAACGGDDSGGDGAGTEVEGGETSENGVAGGEFTDLGTFLGDPPEHIDPALNVTLDAYQVINALYDGLTEINPETNEAEPLVAESFESNEDASVWTFNIRPDNQGWSNGTDTRPVTAGDRLTHGRGRRPGAGATRSTSPHRRLMSVRRGETGSPCRA